jgi:hypothetical protein
MNDCDSMITANPAAAKTNSIDLLLSEGQFTTMDNGSIFCGAKL